MKQTPILFSGEMIRALLEGRKTQTRRICKDKLGPSMADDCPYGERGDICWVRETWADVNTENGPALLYRADENIIYWDDFCIEKCPDGSMNYEKYPGQYSMWWSDLLNGEPDHKWRSARFMFRWASRLTLKITDIRVERVQDISGDDCIAEGIEPNSTGDALEELAFNRADYQELWIKINGKESWDQNPWVWVITFEVIKQNIDEYLKCCH